MSDTPENREPTAPSIGEDLRRERELRGISLKEIADATKISKRFLEAIEKSDYRTLPAPVFTRGFVREYAKYLGLNAEEFVARYSQFVAVEEAREAGDEPTPQRPLRAEPRASVERPSQEIPRPYKKIDRNLIWAVVILIAIIGVIWAVREQRVRQSVRNAATMTSTEAAVAPPPAPKPQPVTTTPQPEETNGLVMDLRITRSSWVALEADGKTVLYDELKPGFQQTVRAESEFRFRTIGNAAGLELTINGVRVPPLGEEGEVIKDRTFDLDYVRELKASQTTQP